MDSKDGTQSESQIRSSELVLLRQRLEKMSEDERAKVDYHASREEYGEAQYHKGCEHAYALASLRVKHLEQQNR